ncbi:MULTISPECIES: winged helix-turn-helix transcriptional regulator [Microbacterium]|uniref:winged helix-turn-helix transcriptional regulator n=1 Tax=Microbacterium TaxID=33882 RepID=UPI0007F33230|nr:MULTISPECIES: helix-turn-helix domain-containing protein [unclassified Microbacterium]OAN39372.1 transcriptional regulator [Microbacterium sp. H83]TCJ21199.1 transcriptional regulator [Microbacterium sp. PI-1]
MPDTAEIEPPTPLTGYEDRCLQTDEGRAIRDLMDRVGDKWSLLIISTLRAGTLRFSELQRHIPGVSQRMLTLTLKHLARDGLVSRTVHPEVPPRVEYSLTPTGRTLIDPAEALAAWAVAHLPAIKAARAEFDAAAG